MIRRPLLAPREVPATYAKYWDKLPKPAWGFPKLDGIRTVIQTGHCLSRTMKRLPSAQLQEDFGGLYGVDGEVICGPVTASDVYNVTQSHVMSEDKPGDLSVHAFDFIRQDFLHMPYFERYHKLEQFIKQQNRPDLKLVPVRTLETMEDALEFEDEMLQLNWEGVMFRDPLGDYKQGRATINEGIIMKLKRFTDEEGIIIGLEQRMENQNEAYIDEAGYQKRSSCQSGRVPTGMVGKFIVRWNGLEIPVGTGNFSHPQLRAFWDDPEAAIGKILKYRHFAHGAKDLPRHPRAIGLRTLSDM